MLYERTLGQWLEHWAETTPDKEYIVYSDRNLRFTWSQFNHRVDDMAKGLISIGVTRGIALRLCKDRGRICHREYQLQAGRIGVSLQKLGHAYALYCQW